MEWTFDPLELKNAHFNLVRLGAVARRYIPDCYGTTESPLHAGLPTDRLVAEWWLDSVRVKEILAGNLPPGECRRERVSIAANISEQKIKDRATGARVQALTREHFLKLFGKEYVATGLETRDDTIDYLLEPRDSVAGLHLPAIDPGLRGNEYLCAFEKSHFVKFICRSSRRLKRASASQNSAAFCWSKTDVDGVIGWGESTAGEDPYYSYETVETAWLIIRDFLWPLVRERELASAEKVWDVLAPVRGHNMAKGGARSRDLGRRSEAEECAAREAARRHARRDYLRCLDRNSAFH